MVDIIYIEEFRRQLKHLVKKYKSSILQDYTNLLSDLRENPYLGTDLGGGLRKVRMAITSKGRGKSGGARVITYVVEKENDEIRITLLTIYDKSETDSVSDNYLKQIVENI